jgi:hypothetical protein
MVNRLARSSRPFPIDAVYTWGDATSERDRELLAERLRRAGRVPRAARAASRFRDLGTLRWSVRALLRFAPWVRTVHIATDGRRPPDLPDDPRIRIVPHAAFFRNSADLPTFNSYAIEANLGFIPDLAEHFIYLNDDMFLGQPAAPELFFDDDGTAICRVDDPLPPRSAWVRLRNWLLNDLRLGTQVFSADLFQRSVGGARDHAAAADGSLRRTVHQASAARASVLRRLWDAPHIGPELARVSARPFRGREDACPFTLMALLACHEGVARIGPGVSSAVCFLRDDNVERDALFRAWLDDRPALFCVNDDVRERGDLARARVGEFLAACFADGSRP